MPLFMLPATRTYLSDLEAENDKLNKALAQAETRANSAESSERVARDELNAKQKTVDSHREVRTRLEAELEDLTEANAELSETNARINAELAGLAAENLEQSRALENLRSGDAARARGGDDSGTVASLTARLEAVEAVLGRYSATNPVVRAIKGALALPPA